MTYGPRYSVTAPCGTIWRKRSSVPKGCGKPCTDAFALAGCYQRNGQWIVDRVVSFRDRDVIRHCPQVLRATLIVEDGQ